MLNNVNITTKWLSYVFISIFSLVSFPFFCFCVDSFRLRSSFFDAQSDTTILRAFWRNSCLSFFEHQQQRKTIEGTATFFIWRAGLCTISGVFSCISRSSWKHAERLREGFAVVCPFLQLAVSVVGEWSRGAPADRMTTAVAQETVSKLLDFNQKLDIALLVSTFYTCSLLLVFPAC